MRILTVAVIFFLTACGGSSGGDSAPPPPPPVQDTTAPVITLSGNSTLSVPYSSAYREPGASAQDNTDGALDVAIAGAVDTRTPGTYTITYTATDAAGNQAQSQRTIIVEPQQVTLRVSTIGDGTYTLDSGAQLDCSARPGECLATFEIGTSITITADPEPGQVFVEWLNCDSTSGASCVVAMTDHRTVLSTIASDAPVVLQPGVVALTSAQIDSIVNFDPNQNRLEFVAGADLSGVAVGNVLVSSGSPGNSIYFGRRVLSVTQGAGNTTVVQTRNAALVEIVKSGTVIARPQFAGTVRRSGPSGHSNPGRIASVARGGSASAIALEFSGEDEIVLYQQGNDKVSLVGSAGIEPTYQAVFDLEDTGFFLPSIRAWRLYADTDISASVTLRVEGDVIQGLGFNENIPVGPTFRYVSSVETAVPVVFQVQPVVGVQAGFEFAAESGLEVSLNDLQTGIQWHRDVGLTPLFSGGQTQFTPLNFLDTVVGAAFLDVAPGANTSALVLGVTGPVLSVGGFGNANLVFDPGAECEISLYTSAGLRFSVAGELELYFWDYSIEFIGADLTLFSDTPFPCSPASSDNSTDSQPPTDVLGVTILAPYAPGGLAVAWSEASDNVAVAYYQVWRFNDNDDAPQPVPVGEPVTTQFTDQGLLGDTRYCYYVTAVDGAGNESALPQNSDFVCETTLSDAARPLVPAPVLAPATPAFANSVALEWTFSGDSGTEFTIYDVTSNANPLPVAVTTATSLTVDGLTTNQTYCFSILAIDGLGRPSAQSNVECAVPDDGFDAQPGWLVFESGDPGIPNDGISIPGEPCPSVSCGYREFTPTGRIRLGPDGTPITLSVYGPRFDFFLRFRLVGYPSYCTATYFGSGGLLPDAPPFDGVEGKYMVIDSATFASLEELARTASDDCLSAPTGSGYIGRIDSSTGGQPFDAAYLAYGAEVFPDDGLPPIPQTPGWVSFNEGIAGVPDDGQLVLGQAPCQGCRPQHTIVEEFVLGPNDGLTLSVYGTEGEALEDVVIRYAGFPEVCKFNVPLGGALPNAPTIRGVAGKYFSLTRTVITTQTQVINIVQAQACGGATREDAYFSSFEMSGNTFLIDGAHVGLGRDVFPDVE